MPATAANTTAAPRWKVIRDELYAQLPGYAYGSSFLTEDEICRRYDVSRITAKRVLDELQAEGLVEKIRKRGTVVRRVPQTSRVRIVIPSSVHANHHTASVVMRRRLAGITRYAQKHHVDFDTLQESHLEMLLSRGHQDIGLLLPHQVTRQTTQFVASRQLPHVFLDPIQGWRRLLHVRVDRREAGRLAASHLIGLGHRRIGFLLGAISQRNFRDRLLGYRVALRDAGLKFDWSLVHETATDDYAEDEQALMALLDLRRPPTAIMTADDSRALHLLEACRQRGIPVPEQISILGYPNYPESSLSDPPLSVIDACYEEVGEAGLRLLLERMHQTGDTRLRSVVVPPALVERGSTAPPPGPSAVHAKGKEP
jgi:DNA-binding LacI/PurR family transcriptional regulator